VQVDDTLPQDEIIRLASDLESYAIVRVGETLRVDMLCVNNASGTYKNSKMRFRRRPDISRARLFLKANPQRT